MSFNRHTSLVNTRTFNIIRAATERTVKIGKKGTQYTYSGAFHTLMTDCILTITQEIDPETMRTYEPTVSLRIYIEESDGEIDVEIGLLSNGLTDLLIAVFDKSDKHEMLDAVTRSQFLDLLTESRGYGSDESSAVQSFAFAAKQWRKENAALCNRLAKSRAVNGEAFIGDDVESEA